MVCINLFLFVLVFPFIFDYFAWKHFCYMCIDVLRAPDFPDICPLCPLWSLNSTLLFCCCFLAWPHMQNMTRSYHLRLLFTCFSGPPWSLQPIAPIWTHLHPFGIIRALFFVFLENMMSGEISPAIARKSCALWPFLFLLALLLCPPVSPTSQRTHPNPSAPVYTCLHSFTSETIIYIM